MLANQRRGHARQSALQQRLSGEQRGFEMPHSARDERVLRALESLGENDREALLLLGWEQLSHCEAAHVLGIRPRTFSVRLHRARTRFAAALVAAGYDISDTVEKTELMEAK